MCLSVPQMPDISIFTNTQPEAGSGSGYSRISYCPGLTNVAASTPWAAIFPPVFEVSCVPLYQFGEVRVINEAAWGRPQLVTKLICFVRALRARNSVSKTTGQFADLRRRQQYRTSPKSERLN